MTKTTILRNFDFISLTDKGIERAKNEDYLAYFDTFNGHVFVVCDGMGGHRGGEIASETAVEAVGEFFNSTYHKNPFEAIENALLHANKKVYDRSKQNNALIGMGTTIILVLIRDNRAYYGHAGDSRLYSFSHKKLNQLTRDHSYINQLLDNKIINEKEAESHPRSNEITKALGLSMNLEPEVTSSAFIPKENDMLLLCSDGLNNMLSDKSMQKVLSTEKIIEEKASDLIDLAIKNGGIDNISIQLIRFHNIDHEYTPITLKNRVFNKIKQTVLNKKISFIAILAILMVVIFLISNRNNKQSGLKHHELIISKGHNTTEDGLLMIYPYRIKNEDNLESIAEKYNIELSYIELLNPNLTKFSEGQHLKIPIQDTYIVEGDDDINIISNLFNIPVIDIMRVNDFCDYKLTVGKELIIPLPSNNKKETVIEN